MVDGDNLRLLSLVADMSAKGELQSSRNDTQPLIQVQEGDVENLAASMMATAAEVSTVAFDATTENPPQMMEVSETASTSNVRAVDVYDVKKTPDMYYHPFHHGGPMATPYVRLFLCYFLNIYYVFSMCANLTFSLLFFLFSSGHMVCHHGATVASECRIHTNSLLPYRHTNRTKITRCCQFFVLHRR